VRRITCASSRQRRQHLLCETHTRVRNATPVWRHIPRCVRRPWWVHQCLAEHARDNNSGGLAPVPEPGRFCSWAVGSLQLRYGFEDAGTTVSSVLTVLRSATTITSTTPYSNWRARETMWLTARGHVSLVEWDATRHVTRDSTSATVRTSRDRKTQDLDRLHETPTALQKEVAHRPIRSGESSAAHRRSGARCFRRPFRTM
jgi:hypothetical protein